MAHRGLTLVRRYRMAKTTDIGDFKIKKVLTILEQLNKNGGISDKQLHDELNDTLIRIGSKVIEHYQAQYDEDEPGVAAHNTRVLLLELIAVAEGTMMVIDCN